MDKVRIQFDKLKLQGKIRIAEKVNIAKVNNFKADSKSNSILYNENMNKLIDDDIDFMLLHEDGHFINPIKKIHMFYFRCIFVFAILMAIILLIFFICNLLSYTVLIILLIFLFLIFLFLMYIWMRIFSQNNEYEADDYACNNIDNPLGIISVFEHTKHLSVRENHPVKNLFNEFSKFTHPSFDDRISRIKENYK